MDATAHNERISKRFDLPATAAAADDAAGLFNAVAAGETDGDAASS